MPISAESSPFHAGEQEVQNRLGVRESIEPWARKVVRPYLPEGHQSFYASLPFLVVAARDGADRPWVTILAGAPGFANAPDPSALAIRTPTVVASAPFLPNLAASAHGTVSINISVTSTSSSFIKLKVEPSSSCSTTAAFTSGSA